MTRRFAWDGLSFDLPADWELAIYRFEKRVTVLEFEDRYATRMEARWVRPRHTMDIDKVQKRYDRASRRLTADARENRILEDLPRGWVGTRFILKNDQSLTTAFFLHEATNLFCFFLIHAEPGEQDEAVMHMRRLAEGLTVHNGPLLPWRLYDIDMEIPREFRLYFARFEPGNKLMQWRWRGRHLWLLSVPLADRILKEHALNEFAAELINSRRLYNAIRLRPGADGAIVVRRSRWRIFGRIDEISRCCFRYTARAAHLTERNQIAALLFHYRRKSDLELWEQINIEA